MNSSDTPSTPSLNRAFAAPPEAAAQNSRDEAAPTPYLFRAGDVIAAVLLAAIFLVMNLLPLWHTDIWAHLKFGQWIVQHRQLPKQEPFSPFADSQPYIHFQWLTQCGLYLLFAAGERLAGGDALHRLAGGVEALRSTFLLLFMLRYIALLFAYRRISGSMPLACVGIVLDCVFLSRVQRPQVVGELFFACLLLALSRPLVSRRALLLIPLLLILWANMHGSYLIGLALIGVFFLGRLLEASRAEGSWNIAAAAKDAQVRRLLLIGVLSAIGIALLNPHGPWLYVYTFQLSRHPNIPTLDEWQPLSFRAGPMSLGGYLFLLLLLLVAQAFSLRTLSATRFLLFASFGVFPLWQQRMMAWWVVLVPWLLLPMWADLGRRLSWSWLHYRSEASAGKTLLAGFVFLIALLGSSPVQWLRAAKPRSLERSLSQGTPWKLAAQLNAPPGDNTYLPELATVLQRNYPAGRFQGRIFASETQGDYLLWALPSDYPVLVYTHIHLFSPEHWQECLTVLSGKEGWRKILARNGVNLVVVEAEQHPDLTKALKTESDWQIVLDETGSPKKRDPRARLLIALRKKPRSMVASKTE